MTDEKKPLIVVLSGLSGSGKGTQAKELIDKYGLGYVVIGDLLREEVASGSELGEKIHEIIHIKGELVPDSIAHKLLWKNISKLPEGKSFILDGYPRSEGQIEGFEKIVSDLGNIDYIFFNIDISDDMAIERLTARRVCEKCKSIFKGKDKKVCEKCGGKLIQRKDDTIEKIRKRLEWGHKDVGPVLDHYRKKGKLIDVDGERPKEEVTKQITEKLEKYL